MNFDELSKQYVILAESEETVEYILNDKVNFEVLIT
jgi:hypothetical protein